MRNFKNFKTLFNLENKTAIVTGAMGILGKTFCRGLAEYGANLVLVDLHQDKLDELAAELSKEYGNNNLHSLLKIDKSTHTLTPLSIINKGLS